MKFEDFKNEMSRQIGLNAKFFKPKENQVLYDFLETIQEKDFEATIDEKTTKPQ